MVLQRRTDDPTIRTVLRSISSACNWWPPWKFEVIHFRVRARKIPFLFLYFISLSGTMERSKRKTYLYDGNIFERNQIVFLHREERFRNIYYFGIYDFIMSMKASNSWKYRPVSDGKCKWIIWNLPAYHMYVSARYEPNLLRICISIRGLFSIYK